MESIVIIDYNIENLGIYIIPYEGQPLGFDIQYFDH